MTDQQQQMSKNIVVLRKRTSAWQSSNGRIHQCVTLQRLKRLSLGTDYMAEELGMSSAEDFFDSIENLQKIPDGIYWLQMQPGSADPETGYLEDWSWKLVPFIIAEADRAEAGR